MRPERRCEKGGDQRATCTSHYDPRPTQIIEGPSDLGQEVCIVNASVSILVKIELRVELDALFTKSCQLL